MELSFIPLRFFKKDDPITYKQRFKEDRALGYLSTAAFEQLYDAFLETIDYMDDDDLQIT